MPRISEADRGNPTNPRREGGVARRAVYLGAGWQRSKGRGGRAFRSERSGRPTDLTGFTTDTVNAVVGRFAEPAFHCDVEIATDPATKLSCPIISVPGGHRFPIRSKRSGPNGQVIQSNTYYIRRPGPQSEPPQSAQEWDELMRRCLANGRDELMNGFRLLLPGGAPATAPETDLDRLSRWFEMSTGDGRN